MFTFEVGSSPVYLGNPDNSLLANWTADKFLATAGAGHQMAAAREDAVNHPLHAHLALVLLLQDGALLHPPPSWNPVLVTNGVKMLALPRRGGGF